jgi:hypothetical protein
MMRLLDLFARTHAELSQAIPPAYTEFIGGFLLEHLAVSA